MVYVIIGLKKNTQRKKPNTVQFTQCSRYFLPIMSLLELKPIVVAIQWALVRIYWIDEPLEW